MAFFCWTHFFNRSSEGVGAHGPAWFFQSGSLSLESIPSFCWHLGLSAAELHVFFVYDMSAHAPALKRRRVCAVIGNPIAHSRSPQLHTLFAQQPDSRVDLTYNRLQGVIGSFREQVEAFFKEGGVGLNVTSPFKEEAYRLAQGDLTARAVQAGAVNTLWKSAHGLAGDNTDGVGLVRDLRRLGLQLEGLQVLLVGAGGAARGVLGPLLEAGCYITLINRSAIKAQQLADSPLFKPYTRKGSLSSAGGLEGAGEERWGLVLNATSAGLRGHGPLLPTVRYRPGGWAYDMNYAAEPTAFMTRALQDGASNVSDGLGMLVEQAAESFYIWHGVRPQTGPARLYSVERPRQSESDVAGATRLSEALLICRIDITAASGE
eukprot:g30678.t1